MLLRSSSSPILNSWNSWIAIHKDASEAELPPIPKPRSMLLSPSSNSSSPGSESSRVWSKKLARTLSESDLFDLTLPPQIPKRKSTARRQKHNLSAVAVKGFENQEKGLNPFSFHQVFSSSSFVEMAGIDEGCSDQVKGKALPLLCGGGFDGGAGGSGICGGRGGRGDGGQDGNGGSDADNEHESTDAYYQRMIEANPESSLLLTNYAKFLKEVRADSIKAEEYCSRAILANPGDGEVLCLYGNLIWENSRDAQRAENYFDQAVQASPNDSFVLASYARFLWETEEEEENEGEDETQQSSFFQGTASCHPPLAAMS